MIVVFDTNIWLSQLGMRSPAASAARFFLKQNKCRLGLPEVIRLEVEVNLRDKLMGFINDIKDSHEQLLTVFGQLREVVLPGEGEVQKIVQELFASTGVPVIDIPFSIESARSSFLKTIHKEQPSNNSQQFKDGFLWADCLGLLDIEDVTLVTVDKAFYRGHKYENGLAENLQREAAKRRRTIRVVDSLAGLLATLPQAIPLDEQALIQAVVAKAEPNVTNFLNKGGFELGERTSVRRRVFATESPDKLFFECSIAIACSDLSGLNRSDGLLELNADGLYLPATAEFEALGVLNTSFKYQGLNGADEVLRGVTIRAGSAVLGHRIVSNVIRHELTGLS